MLAAGCWQADLPALKPEAPATRSPRFLMMKLLPMKTLLLTARASPTVCSFISRHYMLIECLLFTAFCCSCMSKHC